MANQIHPIVDESQKAQMSTCWWRYRKCQGITKVFWIYPLGAMNVYTKFVPIHLVDFEIFHWVSENLLEKKSRGITLWGS